MHALSIVALAVACHRDAPPAHPSDPDVSDQPSSTGTPIGYLIDAAAQLRLRDDQLESLRKIDTNLAAQLKTLDKQLRDASESRQDAPSSTTSNASGTGGRGAGIGRGRGGGRAGGSNPSTDASGTTPRARRVGGESDQLLEARVADVRDAVRQALAIMDPEQQQRSRQILDGHNVDYAPDN